MHIDWAGKRYDFDPEEVDVQQGIVIKMSFGWTMKAWQEALNEVDPQAIQAVFWLMRTQNGESCNLSEQNFPISKFTAAFQKAQEESEAVEATLPGKDDAPANPIPE